ncbi:hypothetical protein GCM10009827_061300 [Dactylosporangium maewongense]|uniref:Uncharacterized protein n=1 Tax=Dactylosporangium maewongense TaxID=634393 RepID=A0ABP4M0T3_9ACTN
MTVPLRDTLRELGERMPPARLSDDPWRRGRRQRRRSRVVAAVVVALLCAAVAVLPGVHLESRPAQGDPAVPAGIELPYFWQATVGMAPPGPATVLFGGYSWGLSSDPYPFEEEGGKLAVVGRNGAYRMLRYPDDKLRAGQDVRLSPDGNLVAQSMLTGGPAGWLVVTDLRTGRSRGYGDGPPACCFEVAAWRPDSGAVLVLHGDNNDFDPGTDRRRAQYILVDLASGALVPVDDVFARDPVASAWVAAFAPDGHGFVATRPSAGGTELRGYDAAGRRLWTRDLGDRRLAGAGAYTPDSSAVALLTIDGCTNTKECDHDRLAARRWRVSYADAATGADREGPALPTVTGPAVRALGWHGDTLIVVQYELEDEILLEPDDTGWSETRHVRVLALRPDGTVSVVLDPPGDVSSIDIAQDLLRDGRFGGPVPAPAALPARWSVIAQAGVLALCVLSPVLLIAALVIRLVRRRRRTARP